MTDYEIYCQLLHKIPETNQSKHLFVKVSDVLVTNPSDRQVARVAVVALLSLAEQDPKALRYALQVCQLVQDEGLMNMVQHVAVVRREAEAFDALKALCPGFEVPVPAWVPKSRPLPSVPDLDKGLESRGLRKILTLAGPSDCDPYQKPVVVAVNQEGKLELVKEIVDESEGPLDLTEMEHAILMDLEFSGFKTNVEVLQFTMSEGHTYLRREFAYGTVLSDVDLKTLTRGQACQLVHDIAKNLVEIHGRGVLFLDFHPGNILTDGTPIDYGHSRRSYGHSLMPNEAVDTFIMDEVYTAPEVVLQRRATKATDIFSLGVLFFQMLQYGAPAFAPAMTENPRLRYAVANALFEPFRMYGVPTDLVSLVYSMLDKVPENRPTAQEVVTRLSPHVSGVTEVFQKISKYKGNRFGAPVALVPMRAGVPHKGHVNLIGKLLDLGFFVLVSLQHTYTWTERDPLPKWVVAGALTEALVERGYPTGDFDFVYTPFEDLRSQHLHFLMLPGWEDVKVIVSGNPEVPKMLEPISEDRVFLKAQDLCGDLTDANGTRLRSAMLSGDEKTLQDMLPPCLFPRWREFLGMFPSHKDVSVDFPVQVSVTVQGPHSVFHQGIPVRRYESPEKAALRRLGIRQNQTSPLKYNGQRYDHEKDTLEVFYRLEPSPGGPSWLGV